MSEPHQEGGERPGQRYRALATLGEGGTATVRLAVAQGPGAFNKLVVLKLLKRELSAEPEFRNMFLQEARLAARLSHPNIVQTNEVFEDDGVPIIVMEYLEGQSLSSVLARARGGAFTRAMHLRVIADALSGLHYAHELTDFDGTPLGLVHRDVSPHNVFITFDGQVKLLDFGLAKLSTSLVETQPGIIKGKIRYISPEQLVGESVDRRSDLYSVGVMLWEAATGERMWRGYSDAQIMARVLEGEMLAPRSVNPDVPEALDALVRKTLSRDRDARPATAAALEAEIEAVLDDLGSVQPRDVAKTVSLLFNDIRLQTKEAIKSQLSRVTSLSAAEYEATHTPAMTLRHALGESNSSSMPNSGTATGMGTGTMSAVAGMVDIPQPAQGRRTWLWFAAAGLALITGIAFFSTNRLAHHQTTPSPVQNTGTSTNTANTLPPDVDRVNVRLTASPADAKIYFDDQLLSANPYSQVMKRDGTRHIVRAESKGYAPASVAVILDQDRDVALLLEPLRGADSSVTGPVQSKRGAPQHRPSEPSRTVAAPPATPATPAPKVDCSPPYYLDNRGIKKFKPECM